MVIVIVAFSLQVEISQRIPYYIYALISFYPMRESHNNDKIETQNHNEYLLLYKEVKILELFWGDL